MGLNPLNQTPSSTIGAGGGGPAPTYDFDAVLEFPKLGAIPLRAGFVDSLNAVGLGLLGNFGFFESPCCAFQCAEARIFYRNARPAIVYTGTAALPDEYLTNTT